MKSKVIILLLSVVFLASCSNSRYGHVPKGNKNTAKIKRHTSRYSKTAEAKKIETIATKTIVETSELPNIHMPDVKQPKVVAKSPKTTNTLKAESKLNTLETNSIINKTLKPQNTEKKTKQTKESDIAKGSWLWYVIVGIVLMLVGAIVPVVGWVFYVIGVIAVIVGLLILLGLL